MHDLMKCGNALPTIRDCARSRRASASSSAAGSTRCSPRGAVGASTSSPLSAATTINVCLAARCDVRRGDGFTGRASRCATWRRTASTRTATRHGQRYLGDLVVHARARARRPPRRVRRSLSGDAQLVAEPAPHDGIDRCRRRCCTDRSGRRSSATPDDATNSWRCFKFVSRNEPRRAPQRAYRTRAIPQSPCCPTVARPMSNAGGCAFARVRARAGPLAGMPLSLTQRPAPSLASSPPPPAPPCGLPRHRLPRRGCQPLCGFSRRRWRRHNAARRRRVERRTSLVQLTYLTSYARWASRNRAASGCSCAAQRGRCPPDEPYAQRVGGADVLV